MFKRLSFVVVITMLFSHSVYSYVCPSEQSIFRALKHAEQKGDFSPFIKFYHQNLPWLINLTQGMPTKADSKHLTFFQIKRTNERLYCFYQWPSQTGQPDNWLSIGLTTTRTIIPGWQDSPYHCESFDLTRCPFRFTENYW